MQGRLGGLQDAWGTGDVSWNCRDAVAVRAGGSGCGGGTS